MKTKNSKKESKTIISTHGGPDLMVHTPTPDMRINKSNLILYFEDFKKSVESEKKDNWIITVLELAFVFSFFLTSSFKDLSFIKHNYILYIYIFIGAIYVVLKVQKSFKKDISKNKQSDPEKMVDIIENNCQKE